MSDRPDFLVVGGGSAGCVLAAELARREAGSVTLVEAGPSEKHPLVSIPFGLVWLMGSKRDWNYQSAPLDAAGGRNITIPRGRMLGGSGSINSMVWFRGCASDFNDWQVPGWTWDEVVPAFKDLENHLKPNRMQGAHPLVEGLARMLGSNGQTAPTPERESAGVFVHNLVAGKRNSAATAYLRKEPKVNIVTGAETDRLIWDRDRAVGVRLVDGTELRSHKGVVLCAGSLGSPAILLRSGLGPAEDLKRISIDARVDAPEIGANLHDHPCSGLHFAGPATGYGLEPRQWPNWALAPFSYAFARKGRFASPTVEGGAFFNARGEDARPDVQTHFIPFFLDWQGHRFALRSGYFADVTLCRPQSRGSLRLASRDPRQAPIIDLGLFCEESDLDTMTAGIGRLRELLQSADFGERRAPEAFPGPQVSGEELKDHIRLNAGTAYHPVGTLRMGGPVSSRLRVKGAENLWVADASVMPQVTSANTNAPSMMIGWKGAELIAEDAA